MKKPYKNHINFPNQIDNLRAQTRKETINHKSEHPRSQPVHIAPHGHKEIQ